MAFLEVIKHVLSRYGMNVSDSPTSGQLAGLEWAVLPTAATKRACRRDALPTSWTTFCALYDNLTVP